MYTYIYIYMYCGATYALLCGLRILLFTTVRVLLLILALSLFPLGNKLNKLVMALIGLQPRAHARCAFPLYT
jgi:hypothetical protein